ncbi:MAG TPA: response regulator [Myxococcota bacterium]|nr:response regulator [Myxococcota bacterium]
MSLSKEKLEGLISRSTDIIVATDRRGRIIYYNDGASRSLGYTQDEILGKFVATVYPNVEEAKRVMRAMRSGDHGGKGIVETFQTTFLSKSGVEIPVAMSATITYDESGAPDGTIGYAKDLREILRKDKLATLGEVAVGLSHEINNPLAVILNLVDLLGREIERLAGERDCSVEFERLHGIQREVTRIASILGRLEEMVETESYATTCYIGPTRMIDLRSPRARAVDAPDLKDIRILVVDDDLGICRSIEEMLSAEGCVVETASNGAEGLRKIETSRFDLVLTDVVMPEMDGYELFSAIRERQPELPVLMMTAFHYDRDHIIKRSRLEGLEDVLFKKPLDPDRLRRVVRETVDRRRA